LAEVLEREAFELREVLDRVDKAFYKKRCGKNDLRHLIWLQDFIEGFVGFGVVVITTCGFRPKAQPKLHLLPGLVCILVEHAALRTEVVLHVHHEHGSFRRFDVDGCRQFRDLQFHRGEPCFYAFDLLMYDGKDLRSERLTDRKQELRRRS